MPFKWIKRHLGLHQKNFDFCPLVEDEQLRLACEVGRTVSKLSRYTFWNSNCMVEAVLTHGLLNFYRVPHVICMGAFLTKDPTEPMKAHAWVRVGARIVVGAAGHQRYAVTAVFVSPKRLLSIPSPEVSS